MKPKKKTTIPIFPLILSSPQYPLPFFIHLTISCQSFAIILLCCHRRAVNMSAASVWTLFKRHNVSESTNHSAWRWTNQRGLRNSPLSTQSPETHATLTYSESPTSPTLPPITIPSIIKSYYLNAGRQLIGPSLNARSVMSRMMISTPLMPRL